MSLISICRPYTVSVRSLLARHMMVDMGHIGLPVFMVPLEISLFLSATEIT